MAVIRYYYSLEFAPSSTPGLSGYGGNWWVWWWRCHVIQLSEL